MDLLIRGAMVYDGTGNPGRRADVAATGGRIEAVGDLSTERAGTDVAAAGLALAPGFIDVHSHDDFAVFLTPEMDFKVAQGVTTDIVGNCGFGACPFRPARAYLAFFGADRHTDSLPRWDTYADYLVAVDANPPSLNVAVRVRAGRSAGCQPDGVAPSDVRHQAGWRLPTPVGARYGRMFWLRWNRLSGS